MVVVSENIHPRGLDFRNQRKLVLLRDVHGWSFRQIAPQLKNLAGEQPSVGTCWEYYKTLSRSLGRRQSKYKNCGRKAWKLTADIQRYLLRTLRERRTQEECTTKTLQTAVARNKGVHVEESTIRKFLLGSGYRWLPRSQKRIYTAAQKAQRLAFAEAVLRLGQAGMEKKLAFAMDGCVLAMPPTNTTERLNFLREQQPRMWRRPSERMKPELAGQDPFAKQTRLDRAIPLWGGLSTGGFATVVMHAKKKLTTEEWVSAVEGGKLVNAIKSLGPEKPDGPWHVLCDNERFLQAPESKTAYRAQKVRLWQIPAKSPDLNPIERFWSYLRRRLRKLDLQDAVRKKAALTKAAYKARVRAVLQSASAQRAAANIAKSLFTTCKDVSRKRGAASSG